MRQPNDHGFGCTSPVERLRTDSLFRELLAKNSLELNFHWGLGLGTPLPGFLTAMALHSPNVIETESPPSVLDRTERFNSLALPLFVSVSPLHEFVRALASPSLGFILKLFASLAAAGFGILGVGAKTRDSNGHFTRSGRVALSGILIAGLLAIVTQTYEFVSGQSKAEADRHRNEKLMLSVQRNLYPMRGLARQEPSRWSSFSLDL